MATKKHFPETKAAAMAVAKAAGKHDLPLLGIVPILRCPFCLREPGTIGVDVDKALATWADHGAVDGAKLLVYGCHDAAGKPALCPHTVYLSIDLEMSGSPTHRWTFVDAAIQHHPLIHAHEAACGDSCGLWDVIEENVCFPSPSAEAQAWRAKLQQPFEFIDASEEVTGDAWSLQARTCMLVAADVGAFLQEAAVLTARENPGFRPCLITVPGGWDAVRSSVH